MCISKMHPTKARVAAIQILDRQSFDQGLSLKIETMLKSSRVMRETVTSS